MKKPVTRPVLVLLACLIVSGCSCKEWGYCAELFPNAERLAENAPDRCDNKAS